jgi:hypothetical protein
MTQTETDLFMEIFITAMERAKKRREFEHFRQCISDFMATSLFPLDNSWDIQELRRCYQDLRKYISATRRERCTK